MLKRFWVWLMRVPEDRRLVSVLVWVNILGAMYGFEWYRVQLSRTRLVFWPVVPDSPLSTLIFGIMLVALYKGRRYPLLEALAYAGITKYGVWSMLVFFQAWSQRGYAYAEELFLWTSHFGMAFQAVLFYRIFAPPRRYLMIAGLWLLFNDYMDYAHGFHPYLPFAEHIPTIRVYTPALSVLVILAYMLARPRANQGTRWFCDVTQRRSVS